MFRLHRSSGEENCRAGSERVHAGGAQYDDAVFDEIDDGPDAQHGDGCVSQTAVDTGHDNSGRDGELGRIIV